MLQGGKEYLMRAHFGLPSVEAEDKEGKPPISVKFEIPYFTTSGIQVGYTHMRAHTHTFSQTCLSMAPLGFFFYSAQAYMLKQIQKIITMVVLSHKPFLIIFHKPACINPFEQSNAVLQ